MWGGTHELPLKYRGYFHFWKRRRDLHSDLSVRSKTQNGFEYVIFINRSDCHVVGTTLCCTIGVGPEKEWLCCEQDGWGCGSGLVWLLSTEGQGFREPQKYVDLCQSQHSPSQLGGASMGVGTGSNKRKGICGEVAVRYHQAQLDMCFSDTADQ